MAGKQLDFRYVPFTITTAAGTAQASPQSTAIALGLVVLVTVEVRIPAGHSGQTGLRVDLVGRTIVPWSDSGSFLSGDNDYFTFDVDLEVDKQLSVVTFNAGNFSHQHYIRFKVSDVALSSPLPGFAPIDVGTITGGQGGPGVPSGSGDGGTSTGSGTPPEPGQPGGPPIITDPDFVALQGAVQQLTATVGDLSSKVDGIAQSVAQLQTQVQQALSAANAAQQAAQQQAKTQQSTGQSMATSVAPRANMGVVSTLASIASGGPGVLPTVQRNTSGQLLDPTTSRVVYSGPNGEGGYGAPQYPGQPSFTLPGGVVAYYTPGQAIQNGNRVALGLPPI